MPYTSLFAKRNSLGPNETLEIEILRQQVCGDFQGISSAIVSATASAAAAVQSRDPTVPQDYPPCTVSEPKLDGCQFNVNGDKLTQR